MFVHLRLHTEFSVTDGTCRIPALAAAAVADGQVALALTDLNNLFGAVQFYRQSRAAGLKPLLGAEVALQGLDGAPGAPSPRVVLLVQNAVGYRHLCELLSRGWTQPDAKDQAVHAWEWLEELGEGLIALSGAQDGPVGQALLRGDAAAAESAAQRLAQIFAQRFYIEVQRAGRADDEAHVCAAVPLAARLGLPVVATHPVQFPTPQDYEAHEARVCIAEGQLLANPQRVRRFTREQYFKSRAQMCALFADLPAALANTVEIARRCNMALVLGKAQLPDFPVPAGLDMAQFFRQQAVQGLEQRLAQLYPDAARRDSERMRYMQRLEFEIGTILQMGFPGYFLIVGDFIRWAKNNGCPVGPGRGSGAGSLVAYALGITDLDPLEYQLLFERFLNPERVSMPDFDIDFCQANRDRVIAYVKQRYGRDAVSQIATFGTMAARAAIRDVGRVMDMPYGFVDAISKLIPNKPGTLVTLQYPPQDKSQRNDKAIYALEAEPLLLERLHKEDEVKTLLEMAQRLEGAVRNIGMHAGGVVIAPGHLSDFCPLYQQPGSDAAVSMYDKDDVESIGLVKFDFLGLATLTVLEIARSLIARRHKGQANFRLEDIPLDDAATYRLFQQGQTEAVFQFESRGMQAMLREAKPTRLEDLIALNALYRPGPMDLIPSFVARKHGKETIEYPHPLLEGILAETYGIMVYQEQVMQTAQILGGYSLGGADLLRRAMGKKKAEEMAEHRAIFRAGAAKQGIDSDKADEVFDLMEKFAGYGFNKSHAAAYSLLAYYTAWIKVHYSAEFYCGNMTVEMDNTDKLAALHADACAMGLHFEPPDVNRSPLRFEPLTDKAIHYGLGAIKGAGQQAVEALIAARAQGPFKSLFDFCARVDRARLNKRALEALIKAGAFDGIEPNRAALLASIDVALEFASIQQANANQGGLFDMMGPDAAGASTQEPPLAQIAPWGVRERLLHEKTAIGFYLSGHLFDEAAQEVRQFAPKTLAGVQESREEQLLAGIVGEFRAIAAQRGRIGLFTLDDGSGAVLEVSVGEELLDAHRDVLKDDALLIARGVVQLDRFSGKLRLKARRLWSLPDARCHFAHWLQVELHLNGAGSAPDIAALLRQFPPQIQPCENGSLQRGLKLRLDVLCHTPQGRARCALALDDASAIYPSDAALAAWRAHAAHGRVALMYAAQDRAA